MNTRTSDQTEVRNAPASKGWYVLAGAAAILFPVLNILPIGYYDIERGIDRGAGILVILAYAALLPAVVALSQELSSVSVPISAAATVCGALAPLMVAVGNFNLLDGSIAVLVRVAALSLWMALSGYLGFSSRLFPSSWAVFSVIPGVMALIGVILYILPQLGISALGSLEGNVTALFFIPAALWTVWTGLLLIWRARRQPSKS